jgi:hypothetical protein
MYCELDNFLSKPNSYVIFSPFQEMVTSKYGHVDTWTFNLWKDGYDANLDPPYSDNYDECAV